MPILKSLTFTAVAGRAHDPVAARRQKLVERLEEQKALLKDPSFVRKTQRRVEVDGQKRLVEKDQKVRPWWRTDASGAVVMTVHYGAKPIEFEKGKSGIVVGPREKLPALIDSLIAAARAGELDELLKGASKPVAAPKGRRAA